MRHIKRMELRELGLQIIRKTNHGAKDNWPEENMGDEAKNSDEKRKANGTKPIFCTQRLALVCHFQPRAAVLGFQIKTIINGFIPTTHPFINRSTYTGFAP
ncbi:hypothetical protein [Pseudorhodobacter antarcticus]|uniref:hypothetical protein n=1 Tax=Pseudorhodobacter antarcticus TaxID=1077947 RepID=UPI0018CF397C|nr:hypothetical protein [Pseudorhodobacter antarcticus]